jgi:hypothetical protein
MNVFGSPSCFGVSCVFSLFPHLSWFFLSTANFATVVKTFRQQWKKSLALVKQDITSKYFQNFASAARILIIAMGTFREHYATFEHIFRVRYKQSAIAQDFIPSTQLHYEVDSLCVESKALCAEE